jgi:hypothetical protein
VLARVGAVGPGAAVLVGQPGRVGGASPQARLQWKRYEHSTPTVRCGLPSARPRRKDGEPGRTLGGDYNIQRGQHNPDGRPSDQSARAQPHPTPPLSCGDGARPEHGRT